MFKSEHVKAWLRLALIVMAVYSSISVCRGIYLGWTGVYLDGQARAREYELFSGGHYPNHNISRFPANEKPTYSVYPPYSFPLFALFFEPWGLTQGKLSLQFFSLLALACMGHVMATRLGIVDATGRALCMVFPAAITGISTAFAVGQFSIICAGLIMAQIVLLEKNRPVAAGICWSLAMIKPQIAIPFALLFLASHHVTGLLIGSVLLLLIAGFTCWWTSVDPYAIVEHYLFNLNIKYFTGSWMEGPGQLASTLGLNLQLMTGLSLLFVVFMMIPISRRFRNMQNNQKMLFLAGAFALAGKLLFYNRLYDTIMLWPAIISVIILAQQKKNTAIASVAVLFLISVILPGTVLVNLPWLVLLVTALWIAALFLLLREGLRNQNPPASGSA